jgi:hypothetical protein
MPNALLQSLNGIPNGAYTVLTALIALLGVVYSLRKHSERERENREIQMRREVYLAAAEAIAQADEYVRQFGNTQLSDAEHRSLIKDYAARTAKIHLVGDLRTITCLIEFNRKFFEITAVLALERGLIMKMKSEVETHGMRIREFQDASKARLNNNQMPPADFQQAIETLRVMDETFRKAVRDLEKQSLAVFRQSFELANQLGKIEIEGVTAMRSDLKFDIDSESYVAMMRAGIEKAHHAQLAYIDSLLLRVDGHTEQRDAAPDAKGEKGA